MTKTLLYVLAAATGLAGFAETAPASASDLSGPPALGQIRAETRMRAPADLTLGDLETVRHSRYDRRKYRPRSRWCGYRRYHGRRCYYTPRILRPFRQG